MRSRAGCHFAAAIGLRSSLEGYTFQIGSSIGVRFKPGRGLDHFRNEGAKLIPPPTADDPYEDEAYRLWAVK